MASLKVTIKRILQKRFIGFLYKKHFITEFNTHYTARSAKSGAVKRNALCKYVFSQKKNRLHPIQNSDVLLNEIARFPYRNRPVYSENTLVQT